MSNVSNNRPYIVVDSETYDFNESNEKPLPESSALFTLNKIEDLVKKYLSDPVAQEEFELDPEALKERTQQIKVGYDQKFEQLSWGTKAACRVVGLIYRMMNCLFSFTGIRIRFETEEDQIDKTLLRINNLLEAPTALPSQLVEDVRKKISGHLDFTSLCQFALVNRDAYKLAASSMLSYARECGFQGESSVQARRFMMRLFSQVFDVAVLRDMLRQLDRDPVHDFPRMNTFFKFFIPNLSNEIRLQEFKNIKTNDMFELFLISNLYNRNNDDKYLDFRAFLCHVGKDWEKTLDVEDGDMRAKGSKALKNAIDYNEAGFVNLLLQHGIEPTEEHLTLSLEEGKDPTVVRLLLDHQASIGQESSYFKEGCGSSSFEIRKAFYKFNLNYCVIDGFYLIEFLAILYRCNSSIDWAVDLEFVLKSAKENGLHLGKQVSTKNSIVRESASDLELGEFKPLSKSRMIDLILENPPEIFIIPEDFVAVVFLLLEYGASIEQTLLFASVFGHTEIVEEILKRLVSFDKGKLTINLLHACGGYDLEEDQDLPDFSKNLDIVKLLLKYGASPNISISRKESDEIFSGDYINALQLAEEKGLTEIAEVLRAHQNEELT